MVVRGEGDISMAYRFFNFATVDDVHYVINGDAGLSDVSCYNYLPDSLGRSIKYLHIKNGHTDLQQNSLFR